MFVMRQNKQHSLSPNATLSTTGGPAREPGASVNTTNAVIRSRKLCYVLQTADGLKTLSRLCHTRNGRRQLLRLAYREGYSVAVNQLGYNVRHAKEYAKSTMGKVRKALISRAVYLKQVEQYAGLMKLAPRKDYRDPRASLYTSRKQLGFSEGPATCNWAQRDYSRTVETSADKKDNGSAAPRTRVPDTSIPVVEYEPETGLTYVNNINHTK